MTLCLALLIPGECALLPVHPGPSRQKWGQDAGPGQSPPTAVMIARRGWTRREWGISGPFVQFRVCKTGRTSRGSWEGNVSGELPASAGPVPVGGAGGGGGHSRGCGRGCGRGGGAWGCAQRSGPGWGGGMRAGQCRRCWRRRSQRPSRAFMGGGCYGPQSAHLENGWPHRLPLLLLQTLPGLQDHVLPPPETFRNTKDVAARLPRPQQWLCPDPPPSASGPQRHVDKPWDTHFPDGEMEASRGPGPG